jgi:peptidoglycan/LPS O-acetylase OafA/YrhL
MGRLGVMIFFVHTSLVLLMSLERTGSAFGPFYLRRAFRVYPLSVAVIVLVQCLHVPRDTFAGFHRLSGFEWFSNITLTQNITRAANAIDPLWSLPFEVQMYFCLPFAFILIRDSRVALLSTIGAAIVAADVIGVSAGIRAFRILDYFPCFFGGVVAYALLRSKRFQRIPARLWPMALAAVLGGYVWFGSGRPIGKIFYAEWSVCLAIGLLIPLFHDGADSVTARASHSIAKYSYGIYLVHIPALWLAFNRLGWVGTTASVATFIAVTATLSVAAYHLIESPMIEYGKRIAQSSGHRMSALSRGSMAERNQHSYRPRPEVVACDEEFVGVNGEQGATSIVSQTLDAHTNRAVAPGGFLPRSGSKL